MKLLLILVPFLIGCQRNVKFPDTMFEYLKSHPEDQACFILYEEYVQGTYCTYYKEKK